MSKKKSLTRLTALYGALMVLAAAVFYGCVQPLEPIPIEVTQVVVVGSSTVTGGAGKAVTGLTVVVNDQLSNPMPGITVTFTADVGTVSPASAVTGADGKASIATWTMPTAKRTGHLTAATSGKSTQFTVT